MSAPPVRSGELLLQVRPLPPERDWPVPNPDWPSVYILIDGEDPFAQVAPDWLGFDPDDVFATGDPLVPRSQPRRVAVCRCSCGEPGCGVIAPVIAFSADGLAIEWRDFRDYTGVFGKPLGPGDPRGGTAWELPTLRFPRDQYLAEVRRAAADRSWETPRRTTSRLLQERIASVSLPEGVGQVEVYPAWDAPGLTMMLRAADGQGMWRTLPVVHGTPVEQADQLAALLVREFADGRRDGEGE